MCESNDEFPILVYKGKKYEPKFHHKILGHENGLLWSRRPSKHLNPENLIVTYVPEKTYEELMAEIFPSKYP